MIKKMNYWTVNDSVNACLEDNKKSCLDIEYVSFYIGNYLQTRQHFHCSYDEFMTAVGNHSVWDVQWLSEIKIVGTDWWLEFDTRLATGWMLHTVPSKPAKYRVPSAFDLSIKTVPLM
jgi:hypothetical protein